MLVLWNLCMKTSIFRYNEWKNYPRIACTVSADCFLPHLTFFFCFWCDNDMFMVGDLCWVWESNSQHWDSCCFVCDYEKITTVPLCADWSKLRNGKSGSKDRLLWWSGLGYLEYTFFTCIRPFLSGYTTANDNFASRLLAAGDTSFTWR